MTQYNNGGGIRGFFKRIWYVIVATCIGAKWQLMQTFSKLRKLDLESVRYRKGDVVVITGGARGIGLEVIKILLETGMHVIMGCRKLSDGENAIKRIRSEGILSGTVDILTLDLMSLESVKEFANQIIAKSLPITVLINNAGIMFPPYKLSTEGLESQFQVNYLSHFLLTDLLFPTLNKSGSSTKYSRVVNVSSCAHYGGEYLDFDDLQMGKFYSSKLGYMNTKLMQVISSTDLNSRMLNSNMNVRFYSLHPGVIQTDLYQYMLMSKCSCFMRMFFLNAEQGAQTAAYTALSPEVENNGGTFLANSRPCKPHPLAFDPVLQRKLFDVSVQLSGISESNFPPATNSSDQNPKDKATVTQVFMVNVE